MQKLHTLSSDNMISKT